MICGMCRAAARIMVEKDVPGGPVVDDEGNLLGVLTEDGA